MRAWKLVLFLVVASAAGCLFGNRQVVLLPSHDSLVRDQLVIHSNFSLPRHHRLIDELVARRDDVVDRLRLPVSDEPIHVYLFESPDRFRQFMAQHYPEFPDRRAFFVESDTWLTVYAFWGDHIAEDLQHEVVHGYLHTMVPHLPLWIDEGLAEYFEVPRGEGGVNRPHLRLLMANDDTPWSPDITSLERLQMPGEMTQREYAESWAWMHFLLDSTAQRRDLLRNYLARLRMTGEAPPLSEVLRSVDPMAGEQLLAHLRSLRDRDGGPPPG